MANSDPYPATLDCGHITAIPRRHHGTYGIGSRWLCRECTSLRVIMNCEGDEHIADALNALRMTHEVQGVVDGDAMGVRFTFDDGSEVA